MGGDGPVRPFFLGGPGGSCFCVAFAPDGARSAVLYVPPFAEEANKARRMASLQARAWAERSVATLLLDPYGTGDSEGDFGDARWERWVSDVGQGIEWLRQQGMEKVWLWGLRTGALLAARCVAEESGRVEGVILWQPVTSGALYLRQFLRLRLAADLQGPNRETTKDLEARLAAGEVLEIAGYDLHPDLARALAEEDVAKLVPPAGLPVWWFEVGSGEEPSVSPASERVIAAWRGAGVCVEARAVAGCPFWATHEITECPALIEATTAVLANRQDAKVAKGKGAG
ncbi:hydrolase 2, exosortase A system-associated [Deferrisoma palaeochoriense]